MEANIRQSHYSPVNNLYLKIEQNNRLLLINHLITQVFFTLRYLVTKFIINNVFVNTQELCCS